MKCTKIEGEFGPLSVLKYSIGNSNDIKTIILAPVYKSERVTMYIYFYTKPSQVSPLHNILDQNSLINSAYRLFKGYAYQFDPSNEQEIFSFRKFVRIVGDFHILPEEVFVGIKEYFGVDLKTPSLLDLCMEKICNDRTWVEKCMGNKDLPSDLKMKIADRFEPQLNNENAPQIGI